TSDPLARTLQDPPTPQPVANPDHEIAGSRLAAPYARPNPTPPNTNAARTTDPLAQTVSEANPSVMMYGGQTVAPPTPSSVAKPTPPRASTLATDAARVPRMGRRATLPGVSMSSVYAHGSQHEL